MKRQQHHINSIYLHREVLLDTYFKGNKPSILLLVNDGQELPALLQDINPSVLVAGIHAGIHRRAEYGTAGVLDYQGQGHLAANYTLFIIRELLPYLHQYYPTMRFTRHAFAGFSLGGLSALDIVWHHPTIFQLAGVFSGSLWWRSKALDAGYQDNRDRIMHQLIHARGYFPGQQFFFECGTADETADRNNNGIIDSIDDTKDLIAALQLKGYQLEKELYYLEIPEGRHDIATWKIAMSTFLQLPFFNG